ncbi:MAG TPA: hypothetical protein VMW75_21455 [Thermoanaerobaculia bacterium]|nr:hypothetical protein [Thermoanaerobaculia bacterium]
MKTSTRWYAIPALVMGAVLGTAIAAGAVAEHPDEYTGNMVNTVGGARFNQPFVLSVDHYADDADVRRLTGTLAAKGQYSLRDELWHERSAGYLRVGGRLGYPVAAVLSQQTPNGRTLHVVLNRPLGAREVQYFTRSSKYPFTVLELSVDSNGKGEGRLLGAAKMQMHGDTLEFVSLGIQPVRLLAVRAD